MDQNNRQAGLTASVGEQFIPPQLVARAIANERQRARRSSFLFFFLAIPALIAWLESILTGAWLITPLNAWALWGARLLGLATGIALWRRIPLPERDDSKGRRVRIVALIGLPVLGAMSFDAFVWHAAHFYEFGFSSTPKEKAIYRVVRLNHGRRYSADLARIDPYRTGVGLDIPIPEEQFAALKDTTVPLCIEVTQRRSRSGEIEVHGNGKYTWKSPRAMTIEPCTD